MKKTNRSSRREFFKSFTRYISFGAITFTGTKLMTRQPVQRLKNQECVNRGICKQCQTFSQCELPAAESLREFKKNHKQVENE